MWLAAHCGLACMHAAYGRPPLPGRGGGAKGHFLGLLLALGWHRMPVTPGRRCAPPSRGSMRCWAGLWVLEGRCVILWHCLLLLALLWHCLVPWHSCDTDSFLDTLVTLFLSFDTPVTLALTQRRCQRGGVTALCVRASVGSSALGLFALLSHAQWNAV